MYVELKIEWLILIVNFLFLIGLDFRKIVIWLVIDVFDKLILFDFRYNVSVFYRLILEYFERIFILFKGMIIYNG